MPGDHVAESQRRPVTVLFSDLSGYTALSEALDPEEVKEIMARIFGQVARVAAEYEGHIEKFVGDAVMILFGVPKVHEDDAVRAIKAAQEIHEIVERMSPQFESLIGRTLSMHSGANTGVIVASEYGAGAMESYLGDAINVAARLSEMAEAGQILVGEGTHRQSEGHFDFEAIGPVSVRGREGTVAAHRVIAGREEPVTVRRVSGLRAALIGRAFELERLAEAVAAMERGEGSVVGICGEPGTGKSRLVEEFRAGLDQERVRWREGLAYDYARNIPYYPIARLIGAAWGIGSGDPPDTVRAKIEDNLQRLGVLSEDAGTYIGGLYALDYPELRDMDPESWRSGLVKVVKALLTALTSGGPTVLHLGDLHWADPSTLELMRELLTEFNYPTVVLCTYRPPFSLLQSDARSGLGYEELHLENLSPSEAASMTESLLQTPEVPRELRTFVQEKAEGNPFYLEELVNSLIESEVLLAEGGGWRLARPLSTADVPLTISGLISARLDRLNHDERRVVQAASVVGRTFSERILAEVLGDRARLESTMASLERLDLVRVRSVEPELEYKFKHALIKDVAYSSLLRAERAELHERVGVAMEKAFEGRRRDLCETLAYHFLRGKSVDKAVDYLRKSGEKSRKRYAVEEAHEYYMQAFRLLAGQPERSKGGDRLLVGLLNDWAHLYYYRGYFRELEELLSSHEELAQSLGLGPELVMFRVCMGMVAYYRERFGESLGHLEEALRMAEEIGDERLLSYPRVWLCHLLSELGRPDEALEYGRKARETITEGDDYYFVYSLGWLGLAAWGKGDANLARHYAGELMSYGGQHANTRATAEGQWILGLSQIAEGDYAAAERSIQTAVDTSPDPYLSCHPRLFLGISQLYQGKHDVAECTLEPAVAFSNERGVDAIGTPCKALLGVSLFAKGEMAKGIGLLEDARKRWRANNARLRYATSENILGQLYLRMLKRESGLDLGLLAKNIGFLVRNLPAAAKKSEAHFRGAIELADGMGNMSIRGQGYLGLAHLYGASGRMDQARACARQAVDDFESANAGAHAERARQAAASLA